MSTRRQKKEIEYDILRCLAKNGVMIAYHIAQKTNLPTSTTDKYVKEFENKGFHPH